VVRRLGTSSCIDAFHPARPFDPSWSLSGSRSISSLPWYTNVNTMEELTRALVGCDDGVCRMEEDHEGRVIQ
jgi:hypothetical protein